MAVDGTTNLIVRCGNPECNVAIDSKCMEGIADPPSCPHYGKALIVVKASDGEGIMAVAPGVRLPHADALSATEAELVLRTKDSNLVALVGPHDAGKTSLIAAVYEMLQLGPIGQYQFGGSVTLHAFEKTAHDARSESRRNDPYTERTKLGELTFYHLDLVNSDGSSRRCALFANRAGEDYMDTQKNQDLAKGYSELPRSDNLTVLVDGEKLLLSVERQLARRDALLTLRALVEAGVTRQWQRLALVLTKVDAVRLAENGAPEALQFFENLATSMSTEYGSHFVEFKTFQVAASPKSNKAVRGEGVATLLDFWMKPPARNEHRTTVLTERPAARAFGRLRVIESEVKQ
jgi:ABC-type uncharacterized transport system ATPase subunit